MLRAALVVDGFNLYHSVHDLGENFLKWADLWHLGQEIIPSKTQTLVSVEFCTAFYPGDHGKRVRHEAYNKALRLRGVKIHEGHYIQEDRNCPACHHEWKRWNEKQTDINVALSIFEGARLDLYDHAYLLSADSDQTATVQWFRKAFPLKAITIVIPPGRPGSKIIRDRGGHSQIQLTRDHFERTHMDGLVTDGRISVVRPYEYAPPPNWVHPKNRPK